MGELEERKARSREFSLARAVIYRLFSRCFSYPDRELLDLFDSARVGEYLDSWRCLGFNSSEDIAKVTGWLNEFPTHQAALDEFEKEYTRLFVNAFPRVPAPPYSSVYLDKYGRVWGQSTAQAARLYEGAGLSIAQGFRDIPDHISAEMEFVSYLIVEQQKTREDASIPIQELASIERRFLTDHLLRWAPAFFSRVAECSRLNFYHVTASLGRQFIEEETKHLGR